MKYICGPVHNRREFSITLPKDKSLIGVLISGGIDSAILYYLLLKENIELGGLHDINPLIVRRRQLSNSLATAVVEQINLSLNLPKVVTLEVGDGTLPDYMQVASGMRDALRSGHKEAYVGVIVRLPEHSIGWDVPKVFDNYFAKYPMLGLDKSQVIELVKQHKQESLFYITSSCDMLDYRCGKCNGCVEREWGFEQNNMQDPGRL